MHISALLMPEIVLGSGVLVLLLVLSLLESLQVYSRYIAQLVLLLVLFSMMFIDVEQPVNLWFGMFVHDSLAYYAKWVLVLATLFMMFFSKSFMQDAALPAFEWYPVLLIQLLGMMVTVSAKHIMSIFLGLELMYLPLYALVATPKDNKLALEASVKYLIMGGLASGFLLYGMSLLYLVARSLSLDDIAIAVNDLLIGSDYVGVFVDQGTAVLLLSVAMVAIVFALVFKFGGGAFFMWVPDVYQGGAFMVVALVSSLPKLVLSVLWIRVFLTALLSAKMIWQMPAFVMGIIAMVVGGFYGLVQDNIRRLLAYSSIAHMGLLIVGLSAASSLATNASLAYVLGYIMASVLIFTVLGQLRYQGEELIYLKHLQGIWRSYPAVAVLLAVCVFSLLGMPPFLGFMTKLYWLFALIDQQYLYIVGLVVLMSVVGCYYYLRVMQAMFFYRDDSIADGLLLRVDSLRQGVLIVAGLAILGLGLYPGWLLGFTAQLLSWR